MLDRRSLLAGTVAAFVAPVAAPSNALADAKRQSLVDQSLDTARKILDGKDFPDARKVMNNARGVMIVPELVQGGFIIGAAGGRGVLMSRTGHSDWSYPAFYGMGSGSIMQAQAIGNQLNVVTVGTGNTVIVNSHQTNNGDQSATVNSDGN